MSSVWITLYLQRAHKASSFWKHCHLKMNPCPFLSSRCYQDLLWGLNPDRWNNWPWSNSNIQLPLCMSKLIKTWSLDCNTFLCVNWTFTTWHGSLTTFSELWSHVWKPEAVLPPFLALSETVLITSILLHLCRIEGGKRKNCVLI